MSSGGGPPTGEEPSTRQELEEALVELERLATKGRRPQRHHARALFLSLGRLLEGEPCAPDLMRRLGSLEKSLGPSWGEAALSELSLACAEHVTAIDTRYLDLPNYDFAYTTAARRRLEWRFVAARALGFETPRALVRDVAAADARLTPYLERRRTGGT